jgi:hypothetical protein
VTHRGPHLPDAAWYRNLILRLIALVLLLPLALIANAIPRLVPRSNDIYFNTSTDEISWRVSQEDSDRLDLHSGTQTRSKTLFAKSKRNERNERVVLKSNGYYEGPVVQIFSEKEERLIVERPLGPLFSEGFASLINGRYVVSENTDYLLALDLEDNTPGPFRLNTSSGADRYVHQSNPFFRTKPVLGTVTASKMFELYAFANQSIELRKEWLISSNGRSFSKFGDSFFSLNPAETLVEQRSAMDGELKATFPVPPVHPSFGATPPSWHLNGRILQMHSNDRQLNYAFDFLRQHALYSPADSPATSILGWPLHQHVYFRHMLFRERNQLTIYNTESGDVKRGYKVPSSFEFAQELTDGRLALIGRGEGITVQVLDPDSGAIQCFTPLRWASCTIPFLVVGLAICAYVLIVRSGQNKFLDCISIALFVLATLCILVLRLDNLPSFRTLQFVEFQVFFALSASVVVASTGWLLLSSAHWRPRLLPLAVAMLGIAISTFFFPTSERLEIQVALFVALVLGLLCSSIVLIAMRCFGFRIVPEAGNELEQAKVRFSFGLKDMLSFTVCVAALCVGGKAVLRLEEYGWIDWNRCEQAILLSCVATIAIAACLSHRPWVFRLGCTVALLSLLTLVFNECFTYYVGNGPIYSACGWFYPHEFEFNLMDEFEDSGAWIANGVRFFGATWVGVFALAIGLRNHGWRLRRLGRRIAIQR